MASNGIMAVSSVQRRAYAGQPRQASLIGLDTASARAAGGPIAPRLWHFNEACLVLLLGQPVDPRCAAPGLPPRDLHIIAIDHTVGAGDGAGCPLGDPGEGDAGPHPRANLGLCFRFGKRCLCHGSSSVGVCGMPTSHGGPPVGQRWPPLCRGAPHSAFLYLADLWGVTAATGLDIADVHM